jgi:hypothetical protein
MSPLDSPLVGRAVVVAGAEAGLLARGPGQDHELLTQQEVLGDRIAPSAQDGAEHSSEEAQVLEHGPDIMPRASSKPPP